ncbi:uncharacterized protein LOC132021200 [Mustela nigripes]|uniref:uncharacterized protein LOC132021200 n=1 Tax=Mustela nigripes TaxID=77151 RepID=UPI00281556A4|nr:uncharacterized protein LOC132021200 [Mustela nigripes]
MLIFYVYPFHIYQSAFHCNEALALHLPLSINNSRILLRSSFFVTHCLIFDNRSTLQLVLLVHHQDSIVLWNLSNFLEHLDVPGPSCTVPAQLKNGSSHFFQDYCFLRVICQLCSRQLHLSKSGGEMIIRVENKLLTSWQQGWKATTERPELPDLVKPRSFQNLWESSRPVTYLLVSAWEGELIGLLAWLKAEGWTKSLSCILSLALLTVLTGSLPCAKNRGFR